MFYIAAIMAYFYIALLLRELNIIKKRERVKYNTGEIKMPPNDKKESLISIWGDHVEEYGRKNFYKSFRSGFNRFDKFFWKVLLKKPCLKQGFFNLFLWL